VRGSGHGCFHPDQVQSGFWKATEELGSIDILVNNAGLVANISPLLRMKKEAWEHELRVDLSGMFYCVQEVPGAMIGRRGGRIINISSMAATVNTPGATIDISPELPSQTIDNSPVLSP
jgi:3-oxoacyl-[acyl-carrier protein] reductase